MNVKMAGGAGLATGTALATHTVMWAGIALAAALLVVAALFLAAMLVPDGDRALSVLKQWVRMIDAVFGRRPRK